MSIIRNSDDDELNEILEDRGGGYSTDMVRKGRFPRPVPPPHEEEDSLDRDSKRLRSLEQWTTGDGRTFVPASSTRKTLDPGVYEIGISDAIGIFFEKVSAKTEDLIRFPDCTSDAVIAEIQKFWKKEEDFKEYGIPFKRGIMLWGPPGGGKTCTIRILISDIIKKGGVVFNFTNPGLMKIGLRVFRTIQPDTPILIIMEDIDSIIEMFSESEVLNIIDGVEDMDKVVFLATTNYPERLGARIVNRPSRFDKRFKIGYPNAEARKLYLEKMIFEDVIKERNIDLDKWVRDTENFTIAHLKELVVAVIILEDPYEDAIKTLRTMKEVAPTSSDEKGSVGFGSKIGNRGWEVSAG